MSSNYILTPDRLVEVVDYVKTKPEFSFDVETHGPHRNVPTLAPVSWLSLATQGLAVAIPMGHPNGSRLISKATRRKDKETGKFNQIPAVWDAPPKQMRPSQVFEILEPIMLDESKIKIAHNATFDLITTAKYYDNIPAPGPYADTIVMQWLLDENMKVKGLKELVKKYFGHDYDKENVGKCVEIHGFSTVAHYAYLDAKYTYLLYQKFLNKIEAQHLQKIYDLEMDVLDVLLDMGMSGANVDVDTLMDLREDLTERLVDTEAKVYRAANARFNINSNPQKQKILYGSKEEGGQGLRPKKFTKAGAPSCDAESLESYPKNDLCVNLLEFADLHKLLNTYVIGYLGDDELEKDCRIFNGKIHADLVQYGTVTGRFSCREPNLQNIPRPSTELGKKIRGLFIAPEAHSLIVADYGQIELVVLAHYSQAKALVDGFNNGIDAHTMTASKVFNVPFDEVTKPMRQASKGINFAVVYGAGPDKVAAMADSSTKEAKKFLEIHQREFPEIYRFKEQVLRVAKGRRPAQITTLMGRKRRLPTLFSPNKEMRMYAERQAVNSLIQGSAADIIKLAMVRLNRTLPDEMRLILSVHDELVVECPDEMVKEGTTLVREAMLGEGISSLLSVPMTSDVAVVKRWSEAK